MKVLELARAEHPNVDEIARTLSSDPALTTKILRMVNSPAYSLRFEVTTVRHAISLLGLITVQTLALSFSLAPGKSADQAGLKSYWKRSAIAAVAARELAKRLELPPEEAFLAGLLQDIGCLALAQIGPPAYRAKIPTNHAALCAAEIAEFGCDHAEAGSWLLKRWRLGASYVAAVQYSHAPLEIPADLEPDMGRFVRAIAVAGRLADVWTHPERATAVDEARALAASELELDSNAFEAVLSVVAGQLVDVGQLLDVQIGSKEDIDAVLDEAREALADLTLQSAMVAETARQTIGTLEARTVELQDEARTDKLTKLANRGALDLFLDRAFSDARRDGRALSVILVDLDHFKSVNDTYGHLTGDQVLMAAAALLGAGVRPRDLAGRWGGEEFVVVLPDTNAAGAMIVAERLRARIAAEPMPRAGGSPITVTASMGCATLGGESSPAELIDAADRALYDAKHSGRNRVVAAVAAPMSRMARAV